ncbi:replication factor C large subunit [Candidatus Woesearchaeota archaeon]|nr:replication factor C large subunit [Candidatus Woesearchaeota archaeon]
MWTKKYAPNSVREIVGNTSSIMKLEGFIKNFKKSKKKAVMIYGPTGTGKTEVVYALSKNYDLEILEVNASDFRNKEMINETVGKAMNQYSLFGKGKIILIDEIDGLSGNNDRGGAQALATLLDKSSFPIIMTANDPWEKKLSSLRSKSIMIEFEALNYLDIFRVLKKIADSEEILISDQDLKTISNSAGGDLRSAINDFYLISYGRKKVKSEDLEGIGDRNREEHIHNLLTLIFKGKNSKAILDSFDNTNLEFNDIKLWIDENLPKEYKGIELKNAYDSLSKSDMFNGRIIRRQYWRFLVYQKYFMSVAIAMSKLENKKGFVSYEPTKRILKIWKSKMKYAKRDVLVDKISSECHVSSKKALKEILPYCQVFLEKEIN